MPSQFHIILYWIYWVIAAYMGIILVAAFFRERDRGVQATLAMVLVPVILRVLGVK